MKVTVHGLGYVGLVQAAVFASSGQQVCCVDIDQDKIQRLKQGNIPIYEPGLAAMVGSALRQGNLFFTSDIAQAVNFSEIHFIAVGTPANPDGSANLDYVLFVGESIATHMHSNKIVVNKSTVPVGTADKVDALIKKKLAMLQKTELNIDLVSNPEFLKEGSAIKDCERPDRIIIGTNSSRAEELMRRLYAPFNRKRDKIILMDARSAELTKYAANCMLATKISFMNEMANIADKVGADIEQVRQGIGSDKRIGFDFIYPGCGYGGSCFPKDVKALINTADSLGYTTSILNSVEQVNAAQKQKLFQYIKAHFKGELQGKTFALWGLTFKPNTDDIREAPSRVLMEALWQQGAVVQAYDPEGMATTRSEYPNNKQLILTNSKEQALIAADALVICTDWQNFKSPDFDLIKQSLNQAVIFDGRNLYEPEHLKEMGFKYYTIGRSAER